MKWNDAAIIALDPRDPTVMRHAQAWRDRYSIPLDRCFAYSDTAVDGFRPLEAKSLSFAGLSTKLIVVCHGLERGLVVQGELVFAESMAGLLVAWGLRSVGLLSFKACLLGVGTFLNDVEADLRRRRVEIGWLIGYRHEVRLGLGRHEVADGADERLRVATNWRGKQADEGRVKIVKGNVHVVPTSGPTKRFPLPRRLETAV
jgi:hypothetical protein